MDKSFDGDFDRKTQNSKRKTNENQTCTSFVTTQVLLKIDN